MLLGSPASGVWTDLQHPVGPPPAGLASATRKSLPGRAGHLALALQTRSAAHQWMLWVELPQSVVLAPMRPLLREVAVLACLVILIGGCGAWLLAAILPVRDRITDGGC